ncbi:hypothetical protein NDI56_00325 [Haloarcula sp. S1CR25-12]|uniref:Uncharacterized protein n=1 Tax=Haloarcula saliterrae TaxID=2950534 RepID=A0ABU2F6M3_9EURY|nr:hypothetical protein [Haloarcula sp. S1CR25-12]MDS0257846.1 hypothetical protein [Haloarcula sp. S1CR25-12]
MDSRTARILRAVAAALVFVTAAYHLWWGFPRSIVYLAAFGSGVPPDPRPFLFVALGLLLLAGPYLISFDVVSLRTAYVGGALLLVGSIAAWVTWHATGHGAFLVDGFSAPASGGGGHSHGSQNTVLLVLDHFNTEPVEAAIKVVETAAVAIFVTLLRLDPSVASRGGDDPSAQADANET